MRRCNAVGAVVLAAAAWPSAARAQHHHAPPLSTPPKPGAASAPAYLDLEHLDIEAGMERDCKVTRTTLPKPALQPDAPPAASSPAVDVPDSAPTMIVGDPGELALQRDRARFINAVTPRSNDHRKRERWEREPLGGATAEGMYEVSIYPCGAAPTAAQRQAAIELWRASRRAAETHGWFDFAAAERLGFHHLPGGDEYHFVNEAALRDGRVLDPEAPEFLLYHRAGEQMMLVGVMFLMPTIADRGPQLGGPLTLWHYHRGATAHCFRDGVMIGTPATTGECVDGATADRTPEMLHVWFIRRDTGAFATDMLPPDEP